MAEPDGCGEPETVPVVVNFSAAIPPPTNIHHKWHKDHLEKYGKLGTSANFHKDQCTCSLMVTEAQTVVQKCNIVIVVYQVQTQPYSMRPSLSGASCQSC